MAELVRGTGFTRGAIPKLLKDRGSNEAVSSAILAALAAKYQVSLDFLSLGRGEPFGDRGLEQLDRVLRERDWSPAAVAAALAHRDAGVQYSEDDWRNWLVKIENVIEGTPAPPPTSVRPRKSS